jgi:hypothetical protein
VALTGVTAIIIQPSSGSATVNQTFATFTAMAQPADVDITGSGEVWTVQDPSGTDVTAEFSLSFVSGTGEEITPLSTAQLPSYTVVASYPGTTAVGTATLNVTQ